MYWRNKISSLFAAHLQFFRVRWVHFHWAISQLAPRVLRAWLVLLVTAPWMSTVFQGATQLVIAPHAHLVQQDMPALILTKMLRYSAQWGAIPLECIQHALHVQQDCKSNIEIFCTFSCNNLFHVHVMYAVLVHLLMLQQWWHVVRAFIHLAINHIALLALKDTSAHLKLWILCKFFDNSTDCKLNNHYFMLK